MTRMCHNESRVSKYGALHLLNCSVMPLDPREKQELMALLEAVRASPLSDEIKAGLVTCIREAAWSRALACPALWRIMPDLEEDAYKLVFRTVWEYTKVGRKIPDEIRERPAWKGES